MSCPLATLSRVVLPALLGPSRACTLPAGTRRSTPSSTRIWPYPALTSAARSATWPPARATRSGSPARPPPSVLTEPTSQQRQAFNLIGAPIPLALK